MKTDIKIYITLGLLIASRLTMSADGASSFVTGGIPSHGSEIINKVNWPKFLERSNPVWHKLPLKWEEAPFLGNGWMGTMIFRNPDNKHELTIQAQHAGVNDHDHKSATGVSSGWNQHRLMIGNFFVATTGEMLDCDWKLDLWNAELTGTINTTKGIVSIRALVHTEDMVTEVELSGPGAEGAKVEFRPIEALSPRVMFAKELQNAPIPKSYLPLNPEPDMLEQDGVKICHQGIQGGGEYATAWTVKTTGDKTLLRFSIAQSFPKNSATAEAVGTLKRVAGIPGAEWVAAHREWWHQIYQRSFLSISDPYWEAFYWMQRYKMAAATRADRCLIDNHGPWMEPTRWPYATWDLNVQLSYWPFYAAGLSDLASSLPNHLRNCSATLISNVPAAYRSDCSGMGGGATESLDSPLVAPRDMHSKKGPLIGDLPWALHDVWLQYRTTMDEMLLRETLFPLLKRSMNFYRHFLVTGSDGFLHLPTTMSPEYMDMGPDCNYDLSLIRWGCETLLWTNDRLKLNDPIAPKWREILAKLTPFPGDEKDGFFIASGVPYAKSHRHYSHLLMIYPLYLVNIDQPGGREKIEKSVGHWLSLSTGFRGFSFTGAASLYAATGDGDRALQYLNGLKPMILPNAMYSEPGPPDPPCIETPLSAAQSMHDMMLQSWGNTIRVFPAWPSAWKDGRFCDLRTEGAFLVSAVRKNGQTQWVRVKSMAGETFRICPNISGEIRITGNGAKHIKMLSAGLYELTLGNGEEVTFSSAASGNGPFVVEPVADPVPYCFGLP